MSIADRREKEKQELRDKILRAAGKLFRKEGYEKVSVRKIANAIDYSVGTIYLYFKNKDDIFFALHEEGFNMLYERMTKALPIAHPVERLREMGRQYMAFAYEFPETYELMFIQSAPMNIIEERLGKPAEDVMPPEKWAAVMRSFGMLYDTVQECIDKGYFKTGDVNLTTFAIWSSVHGMASLQICKRLEKLFPSHLNQTLISDTTDMLLSQYQK
ncbi:MAG: TetR/AcrR family transcriptional regulator [Bacteroidia bacterium]